MMRNTWIPIKVQKHNCLTENYQKKENSPYVKPGSTEYILPRGIGIYHTHEEPIDPDYLPKFTFIFYLKADCVEGTTYSVTVAFKDYQK
jgi:hypothetical protein